jgi:hypothetical protein
MELLLGPILNDISSSAAAHPRRPRRRQVEIIVHLGCGDRASAVVVVEALPTYLLKGELALALVNPPATILCPSRTLAPYDLCHAISHARHSPDPSCVCLQQFGA